jgi:hypothetical protein
VGIWRTNERTNKRTNKRTNERTNQENQKTEREEERKDLSRDKPDFERRKADQQENEEIKVSIALSLSFSFTHTHSLSLSLSLFSNYPFCAGQNRERILARPFSLHRDFSFSWSKKRKVGAFFFLLVWVMPSHYDFVTNFDAFAELCNFFWWWNIILLFKRACYIGLIVPIVSWYWSKMLPKCVKLRFWNVPGLFVGKNNQSPVQM